MFIFVKEATLWGSKKRERVVRWKVENGGRGAGAVSTRTVKIKSLDKDRAMYQRVYKT